MLSSLPRRTVFGLGLAGLLFGALFGAHLGDVCGHPIGFGFSGGSTLLHEIVGAATGRTYASIGAVAGAWVGGIIGLMSAMVWAPAIVRALPLRTWGGIPRSTGEARTYVVM